MGFKKSDWTYHPWWDDTHLTLGRVQITHVSILGEELYFFFVPLFGAASDIKKYFWINSGAASNTTKCKYKEVLLNMLSSDDNFTISESESRAADSDSEDVVNTLGVGAIWIREVLHSHNICMKKIMFVNINYSLEQDWRKSIS